MGQIVPPQLSWRLILLGAALSSTSALGTSALVFLLMGIEAAKQALAITLLIVLAIFSATTFSKFMQRRSARYYFAGGAFFAANLAAFLYFFLIPVFFTYPVWTFGGGLITILVLTCIFVNARMAHKHFAQSWARMDADLVTSKNGTHGINIQKLASSPNMSDTPNIFNFEPRWLSWSLAASALGSMIFGLSFRKPFPESSTFAIGCGATYIGSYMVQWFVIAFHKIRIIRQLEESHGHPLVAIDLPDRRTQQRTI